MKLKCLHCEYEFDGTISKDELGWHSSCPECGCSFDVDVSIDWFEEITNRLRDYSEGDIWSSGDEVLCKTEEVADALADMFECLYRAQDEEILVNIGYYDLVEDERNGELDRYTGWWYVNIN